MSTGSGASLRLDHVNDELSAARSRLQSFFIRMKDDSALYTSRRSQTQFPLNI